MKQKKTEISVVIVAQNEAAKISGCIRSVNRASEILLFDNDSTDATREVAKRLGVITYNLAGGNYSSRKNTAFSKAKSNWILSIDADERVTPELFEEINQLISESKNQYGAYAIPRKNVILGKEFKYGGQWPDYVVRLFKKNKFVRWVGELHEQPVIEGKIGYLKNPLVHHKHDNLSEMVDKTNKWSEVEAKLMLDTGHPKMNLIRFFTAMAREFYLRMIKQRSFLDGGEGVVYALYQVFSRFMSYAKLWEMQIKAKML